MDHRTHLVAVDSSSHGCWALHLYCKFICLPCSVPIPLFIIVPLPPTFFYQCVHTQWAPIMKKNGVFSPVKLKQVLPFLKLFSEEPVVTCHLCLGGGCVVSPPCLFPTFFTKRSGGFGAHCGTSYLLLSFKHLGESGWCPSHHRAIFKKIMRVFGGLYIVWIMWAQTDIARNRKKPGVHSSLSPLHRVHWWGNPVNQGMSTSGRRKCIIFTASRCADY